MSRLLDEIDAFIGETGLSEHRVGIVLANNGRLVPRLREGRRVWPETEMEIRANLKAERKIRKRASSSPSHAPLTEAG